MNRNTLYLANPVLSLYEGEGDSIVVETPEPVTSIPSTPTKDDPNEPVGGDPNARFNQDQLNTIVQDRLAKDRKKHEERYKGLEETYKDLLGDQALDEEKRAKLKADLDNLQKQNRTKEEQAKHEKKQLQDKYENELQGFKEDAVRWEKQHKDFLIERSLLDAAIAHDAYQPTQIFDIVRKWTKLVNVKDENGKETEQLTAVVDLPDIDADTGKPIITQHTPMGAVERLQVLQGNLFKANVVSGVGGNSNTGGGTPGADGSIDPTELTTEQWMKIYKEDRTRLGLKAKRP